MTSAARPRVSIASAETGSVRADLSETADFTITASDQPTGTISVGYTVSETGNFITPVSTTIDLATSGTTTPLSVATSDSDTGTNDADSTITVTLVDGASYTLATSPGQIATATATDDAPAALPVVSISGSGAVTQGYDYTFTVSSNIVATENLDVVIKVDDFPFSVDDIVFTSSTPSGVLVRDSDNFTAINGVVRIPSGESSVSVTLATQESATNFESSAITLVAPGAGANYELHGTLVRIVPSLRNNDVPNENEPRVTIAASSTRAVYVGSSGAMADFVITASHQPASLRTVTVVVSEDQDFISADNEGTKDVDLATTGTTTTYSVPLVDSDTGNTNSDSVITVRLRDTTQADSGGQYAYTLADDNISASVTATDTEPLPEISLSGVPASVTQGYAFSFTISVAGTLAADLPITLELDDGSNGIIAGMSPGTYTADGTSNLTIPQAGSQVVTITNECWGLVMSIRIFRLV